MHWFLSLIAFLFLLVAFVAEITIPDIGYDQLNNVILGSIAFMLAAIYLKMDGKNK